MGLDVAAFVLAMMIVAVVNTRMESNYSWMTLDRRLSGVRASLSFHIHHSMWDVITVPTIDGGLSNPPSKLVDALVITPLAM